MSQQDRSLYENSQYPSRRQPSERREPSRRPRKKRRWGGLSTVWKVLGTLLLVGLCTGAIMCCFFAVYIKTVIVPNADFSLDDFKPGENSIMLYEDRKTGEYKPMTTLLSTTNSIWVDFDEIPKYLIDAAVAIEDQRFWEHPGIDWRRTGKAIIDMFTGNSISGGSTITQQLIKNATKYNETTVKRKITEIVRALRLTKNNSKEDTITYYLNIIPLGSGCEGVGAASYEYFGKPVSQLSLAECASLISITNNPSKYGPYSEARFTTKESGEMWDARKWNKWRQETVLAAMLDQGKITQAEHDAAVAEELVFVRSEDENSEVSVYTWYEETVIADVRKDLKEQLEWSDSRISQALARGGLRIYTCMNPDVQAKAEEIYNNRENLNYKSASGKPMQSSITIIDNSTGDVAAIVGQFGPKKKNLLTNYANTAKRQPGSSIKPLTVYSPALELGLASPITVLDDYPYQVMGGRAWPTNNGLANYSGRTTLRNGLTNSINTIAVRVLADYVTVNESFKFAKERYHLNLVEAMKKGDRVMSDLDVAPLSMGGLTNGVSTRDMAEAFATFPNNGQFSESRTYTKITMMVDGQEVVLLEKPQSRQPILKETTAYYMNSILQDVMTEGTAKGHALRGMHCAGKTGTTSNRYDLWFVGYTPYYTAAVWTGYDQGNEKITAKGNPALNLWQKVMGSVHAGMSDKAFHTPGGLVGVEYCKDSGLLATEFCKLDPRGNRVGSDRIFKEDFPEGRYCTAHTEENVVTVCLDCPILDANGQETGLYHIAGPHCPAERQQKMCLPEYERESVGGAVAKDNIYRKSVVEGYGTCTIHTEPVAPEPTVDPENPWFPFDPANPNPVDPNHPVEPTDPNGGNHTDPGTPMEPVEPMPPDHGGAQEGDGNIFDRPL